METCAIVWYLDDNKIPHMIPKIVDIMIKKIEDKSGQINVTRWKDHAFVGMDIKFLEDGRVKILMKNYITESIDMFIVSVNK